MSDSYHKLLNLGTTVLKKFIPPRAYERLRGMILFRPEDADNLHQVLPRMKAVSGIERMKGFRYPAPGSQPPPSIPQRNSADEIYNIAHYPRDFRNLRSNKKIEINTTKGSVSMVPEDGDLHLPHTGKRKVTLLPYDPTGLRTTKTTTWEATDKELLKIVATHAPRPEWSDKLEAINAERVAKNKPPVIGRPVQFEHSGNYNHVRW